MTLANGRSAGFRRRLAKNDYTIRPIKHYDTAIPPVTEMFRRLIDYYAVKSDHLEGVSLLKLLLPILPQPPVVPPSYNKEPDEEALAVAREHLLFVNIPYGQAEALLQKHEKNLRARKLFVEAAYIRKLAHPHFPGAFAWAQQDKNISVGCSRCGAAINNPKDKLLCESCGTKSAGCGFCWQKESPYELPVSDKHSELTADELAMDTEAESWSGGTRLFNWCALCGHCIHAACAEVSFSSLILLFHYVFLTPTRFLPLKSKKLCCHFLCKSSGRSSSSSTNYHIYITYMSQHPPHGGNGVIRLIEVMDQHTISSDWFRRISSVLLPRNIIFINDHQDHTSCQPGGKAPPLISTISYISYPPSSPTNPKLHKPHRRTQSSSQRPNPNFISSTIHKTPQVPSNKN